jgi:hypothetical protein
MAMRMRPVISSPMPGQAHGVVAGDLDGAFLLKAEHGFAERGRLRVGHADHALELMKSGRR